MVNSAKRAGIYSECVSEEKIMVRSDTIEHHIEDLIKYGFVSPVEDEEQK